MTKDEARRIVLLRTAEAIRGDCDVGGIAEEAEGDGKALDKLTAAAYKLANELLRRAGADFEYRVPDYLR